MYRALSEMEGVDVSPVLETTFKRLAVCVDIWGSASAIDAAVGQPVSQIRKFESVVASARHPSLS